MKIERDDNNNGKKDLITLYMDDSAEDKRTYNLLLYFKKAFTISRSPRSKTQQKKFSNDMTQDELKMILETREQLLAFIQPIWKSKLILKHFQIEATVKTSYLSDSSPPFAFTFMVNTIADLIHDFIGIGESLHVNVLNKFDTISLPTKEGVETIDFYF